MTSFFELYKVKDCISRLCSTPCTHVSHYWQKRSFHVFDTSHDLPWGGLEAAKNVFLYPSSHILSQHPFLHPSEWYHRSPRSPNPWGLGVLPGLPMDWYTTCPAYAVFHLARLKTFRNFSFIPWLLRMIIQAT